MSKWNCISRRTPYPWRRWIVPNVRQPMSLTYAIALFHCQRDIPAKHWISFLSPAWQTLSSLYHRIQQWHECQSLCKHRCSDISVLLPRVYHLYGITPFFLKRALQLMYRIHPQKQKSSWNKFNLSCTKKHTYFGLSSCRFLIRWSVEWNLLLLQLSWCRCHPDHPWTWRWYRQFFCQTIGVIQLGSHPWDAVWNQCWEAWCRTHSFSWLRCLAE